PLELPEHPRRRSHRPRRRVQRDAVVVAGSMDVDLSGGPRSAGPPPGIHPGRRPSADVIHTMNARLKSSLFARLQPSRYAGMYLRFATPALGQAPAWLDTPVKNFQLPRQLPECGLEAVLQRLAKNAGISIGFERTSNCAGHKPSGFPEMVKPLKGDAEVV